MPLPKIMRFTRNPRFDGICSQLSWRNKWCPTADICFKHSGKRKKWSLHLTEQSKHIIVTLSHLSVLSLEHMSPRNLPAPILKAQLAEHCTGNAQRSWVWILLKQPNFFSWLQSDNCFNSLVKCKDHFYLSSITCTSNIHIFHLKIQIKQFKTRPGWSFDLTDFIIVLNM